MASRHADWLKQGKRDLAHARRSLDDGDYEWACFAAQQGAEKVVKALYQKVGGVAWGHSVSALLQELPSSFQIDEKLVDAAKELDKHYIPARYPNSHPQGAPYEYYTRDEAERAIAHAGQIIGVCTDILAGSEENSSAAGESDDLTGEPPSGN